MFPCAHHVQIKAHEPLPFPDNHFDIGYSNAVIEHVGSLKNQKDFITEICRVSKRTFIIAPNRWFPVEHHTCLPFIHYLPKSLFRKIISKSRFAQWSFEQNLNHISLNTLEKMQCEKACIKSGYTGIGVGVLKSNLFAYYI